MSSLTTPEGDQLDLYELIARSRLTPLLGPLRLIYRPGGPPGLHDFEAALADGRVAAIEVTGEVDDHRPRLSRAAERLLSGLVLPGSPSTWAVWLGASARVKAIKPEYLLQLLSDLEASGVRHVTHLGDYRDPFVTRLRAFDIESIRARKPKPGREGKVTVEPGTYGGFGWDGPKTDGWLRDLLDSDRGTNKLGKLSRATAAERHLVIVLDSFSEAGVGVSLALRSRHERGAVDALPSLRPPAPLTHLWILPFTDAWEALVWSHADGWQVVPAAD